MARTDYEYYVRSYFGKRLSEDDYPKYAELAASYIKMRTFGRSPRENDLEEVKKCECELAELFRSHEVSSGVKSYTTDGETVTYDSASSVFERQISDVIYRRLALTGLLYAGERP